MCNRLHQSEKVVDELRKMGVVVEPDYSDKPRPTKIFPSSKVTPRSALTVHRAIGGNRPLVAQLTPWGVPCFVPGKKPGTVLEKLATNARNYNYEVWRPLIADTAHRCLVPFSHFAEPHPEGGKGDDGLPKQAWFSMPGGAVGWFAGVWHEGDRGRTFAFLTTAANDQMRPIHPKAMPVILEPDQFDQWLEGDKAAALALAKPYAGILEMQIETPPA